MIMGEKNENSQTNRIREVIKEKGFQLSEFADALGVTRQNLSHLLVAPSYPTLLRFAAVLKVPLWQLFVSTDEARREASQGVVLDVGVCPHCGQLVKLHLNLDKV